MDTRFWGPSGWKLLHLITFTYEYTTEHAIQFARFFETIPFILPCKFCRASLTEYYEQHPYTIQNSTKSHVMNPTLDLKKWMFRIHNCVNNKLRTQGLYHQANPTYSQVHAVYTSLVKSSWEEQLVVLWDFLFSVGYNHPRNAHSTPMPDCPKAAYRCKDICEKNKWNILPWKQRIQWYTQFWLYLPAVLPPMIAQQWQTVLQQHPPTLRCRASSMAWLWRLRCAIDSQFTDPYRSVCKRIHTFSSDCGKKKEGVTCRKHKKYRIKHTLKNK